MSAVDQHAEAHRLKTECGYGERRIADELGISRHAVRRLLGRPLPEPVVGVVGQDRPVVEPVADQVEEPVGLVDRKARPVDQERPLPGPVVGQPPPVVEGVVVPVAPVGHVVGVARLRLPGARSPWLRVDLSGRRGLLRDLMSLVRVGLQIPYVVEDVIRAFAAAYHQAVATGQLAPGQAYDMQIRVRPCRHTT